MPYCFIKGKARLGQVVHQKTASCVALCSVNKEDNQDLENIVKSCRNEFNNNPKLRKTMGGGIMGIKAQHKVEKLQKAIDAELAQKAGQ